MVNFRNWFKVEQKTDDLENKNKKLEYIIRYTSSQINIMNKKLEFYRRTLKTKDKDNYIKLTGSIKNQDRKSAVYYSQQLVEIRKGLKIVTSSIIALESISNRFDTKLTVETTSTSLIPVIQVVNHIKTNLINVLPNLDSDLTLISHGLMGIVNNDLANSNIHYVSLNNEAKNIVSEAMKKSEKRMVERLPPIPLIIK